MSADTIFVFIARLLLSMILVGWIPVLIAKSKGRKNLFLWWIYGGALFIVALIHALVMKGTLHNAVRKSKYGQMNDLLATGTDINSVDQNGDTPLFIAVKLNNPEMVKYLLQRGADANATGSNTISVNEYAFRNGYDKVSALLNSHHGTGSRNTETTSHDTDAPDIKGVKYVGSV